MKVLYFDCSSGISGDMTVSSLIDLGVPEKVIRDGLALIELDGEFSVDIYKAAKNGIMASRFDVILSGDTSDAPHAHTHDHDVGHGGEHQHIHEHGYKHGHEHIHEHDHDHSHSHNHRTMKIIREMILSSQLDMAVKDTAVAIFEKLAQAEGKVHGKPAEEVGFHEVGAVDSIVDIVAASIALNYLRPDKIVFSVIREGTGHVMCQHGLIPVPVPATLELLNMSGAQIEFTSVRGEMVTPTGAAIAAALGDELGKPCPAGKIVALGYGSGKKDFDHPNVLRTMLVETGEAEREEEICVLETSIDDATGETLSYAMEKLFEAGALDVFFRPVMMKKNRPAYELVVMGKPGQEEKLAEVVFLHTSSIGLRKSLVRRTVMQRQMQTVKTSFGDIEVKVCTYGDIKKSYPEFESVKKAAQAHGATLNQVLKSI